MEIPMSLTPEEYKRIATIASIYRPSQLRQKADFYLKALVFQHDCLLCEFQSKLEKEFDEHFLGTVQVIRDQYQLRLLVELLENIDTDYNSPSPDSVREYLEEIRAQLADKSQAVNDARMNLQKLFDDSPNADHL